MGGDFGPCVTVPAAIECLAELTDLQFILVGDQPTIEQALPSAGVDLASRFEILHSDKTISMNDTPAAALRSRRDSSMALAIEAVKSGRAQACLSAGNTGALMVLSRALLGMQEGIGRPAFMAEIPTMNGHCHVLDLGANVNCDAEHLYQFAIMGSIVAQAVDDNPRPRVGLLNVGKEEIKGNDQVRLAANLLSTQGDLNYIGFVEGDHIFSDEADVIVCDGFVGNVALKTSEGLARMINRFLRQVFNQNIVSRMVGVLAAPILAKVVTQIDPKRHNGASMLGLEGIVVKSHGNADKASFKQAIKRAALEIEKNVPALISDNIAKIQITRE